VTLQRARVILNPAAGTDKAPIHSARIAERLRDRYGPVEISFTTGPGDAEEAARRGLQDGCDTLFVGGGDGTLNEAINGVAAVEGALGRVTFGVVPLGTGNDFAAALGIAADVDAALDILLAGRVREVDLGWLNGRVFANISGGGYIAEVSEAVTPELKSIAGRLAYLVGGAQALVEYEPVRATMAAEPGHIRFGTGVYAFAVCNSRLIGGGRLIAPHAFIDDGLLDVCVIEAMPTLEFVSLLRAVADGTHVEDPRVRYLRATDVTIDFDRTVKVNTDGEVLETRRCEYRVLPGAARFLAGDAPFAAGHRRTQNT
jgi:diacylglycerol kinase (ATP)